MTEKETETVEQPKPVPRSKKRAVRLTANIGSKDQTLARHKHAWSEKMKDGATIQLPEAVALELETRGLVKS